MNLTSPEFEYGELIPERFSQYRDNTSLPLEIGDVPAAAQSLVLIMEDADAPQGGFTHWVVYNIDPRLGRWEEGRLPAEVKIGRNSLGEMAYAGPKPQCGEHRHFVRVFALDRKLAIPAGAIRAEVEEAMAGHVLATANLMGRFVAPEPAVVASA